VSVLYSYERIRSQFPDTGIGWRLRKHTEGHHAIALRELRAGAVKARRPRGTRVGGAERRALHVAEHSFKLDCVMAANYRRSRADVLISRTMERFASRKT
jgi:hypothetical protein